MEFPCVRDRAVVQPIGWRLLLLVIAYFILFTLTDANSSVKSLSASTRHLTYDHPLPHRHKGKQKRKGPKSVASVYSEAASEDPGSSSNCTDKTVGGVATSWPLCSEAQTASADGDSLYAEYESYVIRKVEANALKNGHVLTCPNPAAQCVVQMRGGLRCSWLLEPMLSAAPLGGKLKVFMVGDSTVRDMYTLVQACAPLYQSRLDAHASPGGESIKDDQLDKKLLEAKLHDHLGTLDAEVIVTRNNRTAAAQTLHVVFVHDWEPPRRFAIRMDEVHSKNEAAHEVGVSSIVYFNYGLHTLWLPAGNKRKLVLRQQQCSTARHFEALGSYVQTALDTSLADEHVRFLFGHSHNVCAKKVKEVDQKVFARANLAASVAELCVEKNDCPECGRSVFNERGSAYLYEVTQGGLQGSPVNQLDMYHLTMAAGCKQTPDGMHYKPYVVWSKSLLLAQRVRFQGGRGGARGSPGNTSSYGLTLNRTQGGAAAPAAISISWPGARGQEKAPARGPRPLRRL